MEELTNQTPEAPNAPPPAPESVADPDVIELPPEARAMVAETVQGIAVMYQALGEERERYRQTEVALLREIHERRQELQKLMEVLTRKHVPDAPGQWDWIPEAGAFVRKKNPRPANGAGR